MKTILSIIPYEFTEKDFFEIRSKVKNLPSDHFFSKLPEWSINMDKGNVLPTRYYHQFSGSIETDYPSKSILFDAVPVDTVLSDEVDMAGFETIFEHIDWREIFEKIPLNLASNRFYVPSNVHVVVDLEYLDAGEHEYDLQTSIIGFLDENMVLVEI